MTKQADPIKFRVETITPEKAVEYLGHNKNNRAIRRSFVLRLAADMQAGKFRMTHQPIAFDGEGVLIDGQHRLSAICEANVPVTMYIAEYAKDVDKSTFTGIDDTMKREARDILHMMGKKNLSVPYVAAVAKAMMIGMKPSVETRGVSRQQVVDYAIKHRQALLAAVEMLPKTKFLVFAPLTAVIARAYYTVEEKTLQAFCQILIEGVGGQKEGERGIILFRNQLLSNQLGGGGTRMAVAYAKMEKALDAYINGEQLSKLTEAKEELFPTPEEQKERERAAEEEAANASKKVTSIKKGDEEEAA